MRFKSGRTEMPCGLNPSRGGSGRPFLEQRGHCRSDWPQNAAGRRIRRRGPGASPVADPICVIRKPPSGRRIEIVRDAGLDCSRGQQKPGMPRTGNIEEENAVLIFEHAQQSAACQHLLVRRKMAVMRFVADVSRRRKRNGIDNLPISRGVFVKINDGQKVGRDVGLVARPNIKHRFFLSVPCCAKAYGTPAKVKTKANKAEFLIYPSLAEASSCEARFLPSRFKARAGSQNLQKNPAFSSTDKLMGIRDVRFASSRYRLPAHDRLS